MASIDNALTTLSRAKSFLGISGTTKDFVLTMIILSVSKFIQDTYIKKNVKRQAYSNELHDGKGVPRLYVKHGPIVSGQTITLQKRSTNNNEDSWETIESQNYFVNYAGGFVELIHHNAAWEGLTSGFIEGTQNYRISYTGGWYLPSSANYQDGTDDDLDMPYDLELAVLDFIGVAYNLRKAAGIKSQSVSDVKIEYANELEKHPMIKMSLERYRQHQYS